MQTDGGKLICVFTECTHHSDRDNFRIMLTESLDDGKTWSEKRAFTELTQKDNSYNNSRISKIGDRQFVICDRVQWELVGIYADEGVSGTFAEKKSVKTTRDNST